MSTRFRLGKGFTIGRSGLRYGHSIPGIKGSYASVGKSGTLLAGFGVRHWEPGKRSAAAPSGQDSNTSAVVALVFFLAMIIGLFAFIGAAERDYCKTAPSYATDRTPACAGYTPPTTRP